MKKISSLIFIAFTIFSCTKIEVQEADINIIPKPQNLTIDKGEFVLDANTFIDYNEKSKDAVSLYLKVFKVKAIVGKESDKTIKFEYDSNMANEAYSIDITEKGIFIKASSQQGYIWAVRSLQQMQPIGFKGINESNSLSIPQLKIVDKPAFQWRGSLLDVGRHFMPVDKVKEFINLLSLNKMNVFHWHLTEDQGWRIEIKKYPKLTELGAWRKDGKGGKYGGFYTQEEIKDVVRFATERGITVVPEIEFPGHTLGALTAYPELSCTGKTFEVQTNWGVFDDILCAGNDEVFVFAENVLTEVLDLFPSKYIHIGGDEAPKLRWEHCDKCQARIKKEGLKNEHDLQGYFISRLENFLISHNRKLIGWDEIMEGGLATEATMQVWRDMEYGKQAIAQGHDIISSPTSHCYLDYSQKILDLEKIYSFNPIPKGVEGDAVKHVLGGEGNLWTERIPPSRLNFMAFPRLIALSEALWTDASIKNYADFYKRLQKQYLVLDKMGIIYGPEGDIMNIESSVADDDSFEIKITPKAEGVSFRYHFSDNTSEIFNYTEPIRFKKSTILTVQAYRNSKKYGEPQNLSFVDHIGRLANLKLKYQPNEGYNANKNTVIDGLLGSVNFKDGKWQAFNDNLIATFNFDEVQEVKEVIVHSLSNVSSWIFLPKAVTVYVSEDGLKYRNVGIVNNSEEYQGAINKLKSFKVSFPKVRVKSIKIEVKNYGEIPDWHGGRGQQSYLFIDEVVIN
jgi:hexosaminidase